MKSRFNNYRGFTLIEMLIVVTILGILLSMAVPSYQRSIRQARETVLRENLYILRQTLDQFTLDKKRPPASLDELVAEEYLRYLPNDITGTPDTWQEEICDLLISPEQASPGLCNVRSGSSELATDGTPYSSW